jgi:hypothetical protein
VYGEPRIAAESRLKQPPSSYSGAAAADTAAETQWPANTADESRLKQSPYIKIAGNTGEQQPWRLSPAITAEESPLSLLPSGNSAGANTVGGGLQRKGGLSDPANNSYQTAFGLNRGGHRNIFALKSANPLMFSCMRHVQR